MQHSTLYSSVPREAGKLMEPDYLPDWTRHQKRQLCQEILTDAELRLAKDFNELACEAMTEDDGFLKELENLWHINDATAAGQLIFKTLARYSRDQICDNRNVEWSELTD